MTVAKVCSDLFRQGKAAFRRLLTSAPFHRGGGGTHRRAAAGVEEEVGSVSCGRRLVRDRPMAERHPHNCSHVSLGAKDMDGDPSRLSCMHTQEQSALGAEGKEQDQLQPKQSV